MRNFIIALWNRFTLPKVDGTAIVSAKPVIHTDVYHGDPDSGWFFNWYDEKHEDGELYGPYENHEDAIFMRGVFTEKKERQGYLVIKENSSAAKA